jgi:fumarate reductase subunit C
MAQVRTYVRPMQGWWRRNPYFVRYMIREGSSVFLAIYTIILLVGLLRFSQGEAAWEGWRAALTSPGPSSFTGSRC